MHHTPVTSSNIASVGYDPATRVMEVRFTNGGTYRYHDVDPAAHRALVGAKSVGTHFHQHVKPKFACTRGGS